MGNLALGASPARAWTVSIAGSTPQARLASAPVVVGGKLYVIDADARVIAFDANSGAKLWQTPLPAAGSGRALFGGGVSVVDGKLYASTGIGDVAAIDANTGAILWKKRPGEIGRAHV